ncbi:MAG: class I SAM-dependent methyltransferase [Anaerolineae bacterium]
MMPWYEASFGCEYLNLYAHRDVAEARANIRALTQLLPLSKDEPLLDLCCGAGRHLLALYELGCHRLVGLDLSAELLAVAAESLAGMEGITLVRADMRQLPFAGCFTTVLSLFTSFGYFDKDEENRAALAAVCQALRQRGVFVLDYLNRDYVVSHLVSSDERELSGRRVRNIRRLTDDGRRVEKVTTVVTEAGDRRQFFESVRLYSLAEMQEMLHSEGFANISAYGSLAGQEFGPGSERLILVAEKG